MANSKLVAVTQRDNLFKKWLKSPIADLLLGHNLGVYSREYRSPDLLICACMDYRVTFNIPPGSAFIIRTPGANLIANEFGLATAVALAGIRAVAIIAHTDCAMTRIADNSARFEEGLARAGWSKKHAQRFYAEEVNSHKVTDPAGFVVEQCQQLRERYANVLFAPLVYDVADGKLWQVGE